MRELTNAEVLQYAQVLNEIKEIKEEMGMILKSAYWNIALSRKHMGYAKITPHDYDLNMKASVKIGYNEEEKIVVKPIDTQQNPLHWFGILVPSTLTQSQQQFKSCIPLLAQLLQKQLLLKQLEENLKHP